MGYKEEMSTFGSYVTYGLVAAVFLLTYNLKQFYQLAVGFALFYAIALIIRTTFFKDRPKKEPHHDLISKFTANTLLSIHSGRSIILAAVIAAYFSFQPAITVLFAVMVAVTCLSRYLLGKHRPIDIAAGLLTGALIALAVLSFV